ncbi:hypothetical protein P154DRAFT_3468 [Amniculicola lignicola CBS 123094]|uniref:Aminoglycoside phosphotransferase domain-containing protein n=1 Tax=Amniculicola lignicola CBS 123094 TaxID=1392246 RepID=A0A6A5X4G9_9PLEO|nr:hypothetical protein P154DRAFT_3468 [Amniculicola lignicola CBS 123094]
MDSRNGQRAGPFKSVASFHDWYSSINLPAGTLGFYRHLLPDTHSIRFAHADLHTANILVPHTGRPGILAVIDWGQAGWYPDYWDYCKSRYIASPKEEWEVECIPRIFGRTLEEWYGSWSVP